MILKLFVLMALTDAWLKANYNKQRDSQTEKTDRDGMGARVSPKGKITFQMRFMFSGKQQRIDLGTYPLISLKQAREICTNFRAELEKGNDPRLIKRYEKKKNVERASLSTIFYKWHELYCVENKSNSHEIKRTFEIHVLPELGDMPPDWITVDQWLTLLEAIKKKTPSIAERILINAKQILAWAVRRRLIDKNDLEPITAKRDLSINKRPGTRSLSDDEIRWLFLALDNSRTAMKNKVFIKLCLIYGCRNGELRIAKKQHFDFESKVWTVPPENHKTGKITGQPLLRPITPEIEELIKLAIALSMGEYVFNNEGTNEPMGRQAPGSFPYNVMQTLRKKFSYEMQHWSIHDLRKTARTNFSKLTQPHIAEIMLGHKLPGEWRTYDRHDYLEEQAECLRLWVNRLNEIQALG